MSQHPLLFKYAAVQTFSNDSAGKSLQYELLLLQIQRIAFDLMFIPVFTPCGLQRNSNVSACQLMNSDTCRARLGLVFPNFQNMGAPNTALLAHANSTGLVIISA